MERTSEVFESFADALPFGVLIVQSDRLTVCWNRRAEQITGFQRQDVLGHKCDELSLPGWERERCDGSGDGCRLIPKVRPGLLTEMVFTHKEGHSVPLMVEVISLADGTETKQAPVAVIFQERTASREMRLWTTQAQTLTHEEYGLPSIQETREELLVSMPQANTGILLMELVGSEQMARHFGTELVHTVVRRLIRSVSHLVAFPHFLGHWSDGRLLLMVPNCAGESLEQLARALKAASGSYGIRWWGDRIAPRIRVSGVSSGERESAEMALKRLEEKFEALKSERE